MSSSKEAAAIWRKAWFGQVVGIVALAGLLTGLGISFRKIGAYADTVVTHNGAPPLRRVVLLHPPAWLSAPLLNAIAQETVHFAIDNRAHPGRAKALRDPLNGRILGQIARNYLRHQSEGENAWVKSVLFVRRRVVGRQQQIQIAAVYRRPVAVVKKGTSYFLLTSHGTRLPGAYTAAAIAPLRSLLLVRGVRAPAPAPGRKFRAGGLLAALKVGALLAGQPYRSQIAAIDVRNYDGRVDTLAPQLVLDTVFGTQIWWGRPPGREGFFEIPASAKLKALSEVYYHYNRIDAGKAYVDIRTEEVKVPRRLPGQAH